MTLTIHGRPPASVAASDLLAVSGMSVSVPGRGRREQLHLLEDVTFSVGAGRCTAVIGESGSGKSTLLKGLLRTVGKGSRTTGRVHLDGVEVSDLRDREFAKLRGSSMALVAQNALAALDPLFPVGGQVAYLARRHTGGDRAASRETAVRLLGKVGLPDPERTAQRLPHELSGGMRQRCVLAMALACGPRLLLADEPTTALDVITQANALQLLRGLQHELGMSMLFVTHDIGVAASVADDVVVLYAGRVVEQGPVLDVLSSPLHPYTQGLIDANRPPAPGERWRAIGGEPPQPGQRAGGCAFAPRCAEASSMSRTQRPELVRVGSVTVACHARTGGAAAPLDPPPPGAAPT
ncbi:MAG: methionine transporter ATP-binding protein [Frankiales bacterium]|jgi:oligopeptide/dipeptide ABC transporter ATP-binding protein|nr:methionine transporter ATP-binding protein [Frankiales bacterium]